MKEGLKKYKLNTRNLYKNVKSRQNGLKIRTNKSKRGTMNN